MVINKASLEGLQTSFKAIAMQSFKDAPRIDVSRFITDMPVTGGKLTLGWAAFLGKMREWLGDRQINDIVAGNFSITPKHYEITVGVKRDDMDDDNMGQYGPQIALIADGAVRFLDQLCVDAIIANGTCWDGQPLVDNSHPAFGPYAAFDNLYGATALTADATGYGHVLASMGVMRGFKDANRDSLGLNPDTLVVPLELQAVAEVLVKSQFKVGTTADYNALSGLTLLVLPLSDATNWYIVDSKAQIKPLVRGIRKPPTFESAVDPSDSRVFLSGEFLYGADARADVVPGFPQAIVGSIVA